ncbi:MAG: bacillithiol biosynthesis cysteine-adding enzyme BshC [Ignavibacteriales bacterium]|nr:bacillithiol biosynthesis cysteine-adding enzyme BshC [Ignavibacteriales bacterium]
MNTIQQIEIKDLPRTEGGFSLLYKDFIDDFQKVHRFYETDFHSLSSLHDVANKLSKRFTHRELLVQVLLKQNQRYGVSQSTIDNINLLHDHRTLAIVTGQQVGILSGPLYTIYKTITTIKLAKELNNVLPEFRFVPIFWLEGEDHDFGEVNKVNILNTDNSPVTLEYLLSSKIGGKNLGSVGELIFDNNLEHFLDALQKTLANTEFKQSVIDFIKTHYRQGISFNQAFVSFMSKLFENDGLIFISSNDVRFKKILSPIFLKEIYEYPRVSQLIIEQSAHLEEQYHAQIKTKALNLFYFHKNGRYLIEPRDNDFSLKGTRHIISKDEMLRSVQDAPELFSPNVALRPICQDTILPTAVYVAGPSEIAYFAQLKKVYNYFNLTMPMIYPRATVTLIEEKFERIMEKYQVELMEIFGDISKVETKVIDIVSEVKIDEMFAEAFQKVADLTNEMKYGLNYIDGTLIGSLDTTKEKIEQQLSVLKDKVVEAQKRKYDIALRQIGKVINNIYPNTNFQERELNIVYFLNKHGFDFIHSLKNAIEINKFKHQIIKAT